MSTVVASPYKKDTCKVCNETYVYDHIIVEICSQCLNAEVLQMIKNNAAIKSQRSSVRFYGFELMAKNRICAGKK